MIPNNILTDIFLYFARFPKREGIFPLFNAGASEMAGYSDLRQLLNVMPEHSLTKIENYIFGASFDAVMTRVNNIETGKDFLFVDFGEIDCGTDRLNRMADSARLAISVAYRIKSFSSDLVEQMLAFSHSFNKLIFIRNKMFDEQRSHPWLKDISDNHTFVPFVSKEMSSVGWTLMFNREGYDSFGAKNYSC